MKDKTLDKLLWAIRYIDRVAKENNLPFEFVASLFQGMDDVRHNRLYTVDLKTMKHKKVPHYGDKRYAKK